MLEDSAFTFEGVSGTSAGAMNALCLAHGLMIGGRDGARETLARFWTSVAASSPFAGASEGNGEVSPVLKLMLQWTTHLSPEQINPFDLNPLRDIIEAQFDFERLRRSSPVQLFIAATHANSGKLRLFRNAELTTDTLLASACLPTIHRSVVIDGEPYWDGGYSANPAVFPLAYQCRSADILLVLLTPLRYAETPVTADDIRQRLLELSFNSTFLREMRMFAHLREEVGGSGLGHRLLRWLPVGRLERRVAELRFHAISADAVLGELPPGSKLSVNLPFFENLRDRGREHARHWLDTYRNKVGRQATLDLGQLFY